MKNSQAIAFFDFDGTITRSDSFLIFTKFLVGKWKFYSGLFLLTPFIVLHLMRILKDYQLKRIVCKYFLGGKSRKVLEQKAFEFFKGVLPSILRKKALEKIAWHKNRGHKIALVSASFDLWLKDFAEQNQMILISSKLESKNGVITGNLDGLNCKGMEKVNRIQQVFNLKEFNKIYAYGDSAGDKEMLEIADEKYYKPFLEF